MGRGRPPGQKYSKVVAFRLAEEAMSDLEKIAEEERRPVAQMARILVEDALKARKGISQPPSGAVRKRKS
jgi:hypothetical protein